MRQTFKKRSTGSATVFVVRCFAAVSKFVDDRIVEFEEQEMCLSDDKVLVISFVANDSFSGRFRFIDGANRSEAS